MFKMFNKDVEKPSPLHDRTKNIISQQRINDGREEMQISDNGITINRGSSMSLNGVQNSNITVHGKLDGDFSLNGNITIRGEDGEVSGNIKCHMITIADGARFNGTVTTECIRIDEKSFCYGIVKTKEIIVKKGGVLSANVEVGL